MGDSSRSVVYKPPYFFVNQMSKTSLTLKQGDILKGNNKEKLIGYIKRLNTELGFIISTNYKSNERISTISGQMIPHLNSLEYGLHIGNTVNDANITRFIQWVKTNRPKDRPLEWNDLLIGLNPIKPCMMILRKRSVWT